MTKTPSVKQTKKQFTSNLAPGIAGGAGIVVGRAALGNTLGPIAGGTLAGAAIGGSKGDMITINSMMLSADNLGK